MVRKLQAGGSIRSEKTIPGALLEEYGSVTVTLLKGQTLFDQGDPARDFFVVRSGRIRMVMVTERGREFVQGYFQDGQSFGEPPFFSGDPYPASADAVEDSRVWRCPGVSFLRLLRENPEIHLSITRTLSQRIFYKAMMLGEIAVEEAEHRLTTLISYFRKSQGMPKGAEYRVTYTRQQLADMTGLRVETVIRTVKAMEEKGLLRIQRGNVLWDSSREPDSLNEGD